ncbi:MAG: hypothetical protein QXI11_02080 [Thermoproteota archaeon]
MVVVYFDRLSGVSWYWPDVLATIGNVFEKRYSCFRRILVDVGLNTLVRRFGKVFYTRGFLDRYVAVCRGFYDCFGGRFSAIVPDYPPVWKGVPVDNYLERHYEVLLEFSRLGDPFWVGVFRYEGLGISEIESVADRYGEILDRFKVLAIPARNPIIHPMQFIEAVKVVKKNFPSKRIHLLGPRMELLRVCYRGICDSLDFGETMTRINVLKGEYANVTNLNEDERRKLMFSRLEYKGLTAMYWVKVNRLISLVEQYIGEVER